MSPAPGSLRDKWVDEEKLGGGRACDLSYGADGCNLIDTLGYASMQMEAPGFVARTLPLLPPKFPQTKTHLI